jgi:hypothetical protein
LNNIFRHIVTHAPSARPTSARIRIILHPPGQ